MSSSTTPPRPPSYNTEPEYDNKIKALKVDIGLRNDMMRFIKQRIIHNLEMIRIFLALQKKEYDDICAGIFTYAVEEYGKILYLSDLKPSPDINNKIKIPYAHNQGFHEHNSKFNLALKNLPDDVKVLIEGGFTSSGFTKSGFSTDTFADFETRLAVFYTDFDKNNNYHSILIPPIPTRDLLEKGVNEFLKLMNTLKIP